MELSKAKETLIQNVEIDLSDRFPEEEKKQFVKLRPMIVKEMVPFSRYQAQIHKEDGTGLEELTNQYLSLLPNLIIEHSFYNGEKPASNKEVADFLSADTALFMEVMNLYMSSQSLVKGKGKS